MPVPPLPTKAGAALLAVLAAAAGLGAGVLFLAGFASPSNWLLALPVAGLAGGAGWSGWAAQEGRPAARVVAVALAAGSLAVEVVEAAATGGVGPLTWTCVVVTGVAAGCLLTPAHTAYVEAATEATTEATTDATTDATDAPTVDRPSGLSRRT